MRESRVSEKVPAFIDRIESDKMGLQVYTDKTKIVVFRKRGGFKDDESWTYNGVSLEVVNDFNYLGTVFNFTGSFALNHEMQI